MADYDWFRQDFELTEAERQHANARRERQFTRARAFLQGLLNRGYGLPAARAITRSLLPLPSDVINHAAGTLVRAPWTNEHTAIGATLDDGRLVLDLTDPYALAVAADFARSAQPLDPELAAQISRAVSAATVELEAGFGDTQKAA